MIEDFAKRLVCLCLTYRGSVTSWGRTELHNLEVGGMQWSLHHSFLAADITFDSEQGCNEAKVGAHRMGLFWNPISTTSLHIQALPSVRYQPASKKGE